MLPPVVDTCPLIIPSPDKAISPLGKVLALLLQKTGTQIDPNEFADIDEIAKGMTDFQQQLIELDRQLETVKETADEAANDAAQTGLDLMQLTDQIDKLLPTLPGTAVVR